MSGKREIDDVTGIETTGHTWDDIKELNKPLPKWWLMTFYASIVWAIGYMIVYPAWPTLNGYTKGIWGYSQRVVVSNEVQDAKAAQATFRAALEKTALADVKNDPDLLRFAMVGGAAEVFKYGVLVDAPTRRFVADMLGALSIAVWRQRILAQHAPA